jgi:hypothetical protein
VHHLCGLKAKIKARRMVLLISTMVSRMLYAAAAAAVATGEAMGKPGKGCLKSDNKGDCVALLAFAEALDIKKWTKASGWLEVRPPARPLPSFHLQSESCCNMHAAGNAGERGEWEMAECTS